MNGFLLLVFRIDWKLTSCLFFQFQELVGSVEKAEEGCHGVDKWNKQEVHPIGSIWIIPVKILYYLWPPSNLQLHHQFWFTNTIFLYSHRSLNLTLKKAFYFSRVSCDVQSIKKKDVKCKGVSEDLLSRTGLKNSTRVEGVGKTRSGSPSKIGFTAR